MAWIRQELRELGIPPLKRFGQHFLLSQQVRDKLVNQAELTPTDTVVEVGAGLGFVTGLLASKAGHVVAIEKDRTLAKHLTEKFSANRNVEVVHGDALVYAIPTGAHIVSSPPYNISSKLILRIIRSQFKLASLLLQEDFIKRLTAPTGSREYGRLTVTLQTQARAEQVSRVPKSAFYPEPSVDSAITIIRPINEITAPKDSRIFEDLVRGLFTQRRRKLRGVLSRYLALNYPNQKEAILRKADLDEKRVYELTPIEFISLSDLIVDSTKL